MHNGLAMDDPNIIPLHRLATGQVDVIKAANGNIISARISSRQIYEILYERRIISDSQLRCAYQFMDMKRAFTSRSGYAKMMQTIAEIFTHDEEPKGDLERFYRLVCKAIGREIEGRILIAMTEDYERHAYPKAHDDFWKLEIAFIRCKKILDEEAEPR